MVSRNEVVDQLTRESPQPAKCMCDYKGIPRKGGEIDNIHRDRSIRPWRWSRICIMCEHLGEDLLPDIAYYVQVLVKKRVAVNIYHEKKLKRGKIKKKLFRLEGGDLLQLSGQITEWYGDQHVFNREYLPVGMYRSTDGWVIDLRYEIGTYYEALKQEGLKSGHIPVCMSMTRYALFDANVIGIIRGFATGFSPPRRRRIEEKNQSHMSTS